MNILSQHKESLAQKGFSKTESIFSNEELQELINLIGNTEKKYAIRQLIHKVPEIWNVIFKNEKFTQLYDDVCNDTFFLSKAIFFNKPSKSNWFVSYHQDLSISVKERIEIEGYTKWTNKNGQLRVIPPKEVLEIIMTIRIHLDKTEATNGALKVIPGSHDKGIIRVDASFDKDNYGEVIVCEVAKGGVMLMKPLLLHASSKSISEFDRRVIHLEFCNKEIPIQWLERKSVS